MVWRREKVLKNAGEDQRGFRREKADGQARKGIPATIDDKGGERVVGKVDLRLTSCKLHCKIKMVYNLQGSQTNWVLFLDSEEPLDSQQWKYRSSNIQSQNQHIKSSVVFI